MFKSTIRSAGDEAGVFEYDGDTGYFYLYKVKGRKGQKVIAAIKVLSGTPDFLEEDVTVRWNSMENKVGLFIHKQLWAVFNSETYEKYGGNYCAGNQPAIPSKIVTFFELQ